MSSRRNFLRGKLSAAPEQPRPPWAIDEGDFLSFCTRCGDCARACPSGIIRQGGGGYPIVDFRFGECTFCGDCVQACKPQALKRDDGSVPWRLYAAIGEKCLARRQVECRICGEQCGESAIRFPPQVGGVARPLVDVTRCTGCGACVAPCPVAAITVE